MQLAALVCLGLRGTMRHCKVVADFLQHSDERFVQAAEEALWMIWMRAGTPTGNKLLESAVERIRRDAYGEALGLLDCLATREPEFAELYHQRGIALSMLDRYDEAGEAFRQVLRLNPYHYSAALNLGHTCVHAKDLRGALRYYRQALRMHPRLPEIPGAVERLEAVVGNGNGKNGV